MSTKLSNVSTVTTSDANRAGGRAGDHIVAPHGSRGDGRSRTDARDGNAHAKQPERWAVVGGGMLGLTLALRLAQAGKSVSLFEAAPDAGGLAGAWQLGDVVWDKHYHVTLLSDLAVRGVLEELGLADDMRWVETRTGFYLGDGRLVSMSNSVEFLKFPPLNLIDKFRLGATIIYASRITDPQPLEKISVADWLRKLSGKRTFNRIWLPLLRSKLGENYTQVSAAFIWATIARMYAARRTGLKREMFGYVRGGYANILERFTRKLRDSGVELNFDCALESVERMAADDAQSESSVDESRSDAAGAIMRLRFADGREENFDKVVLTVPSSVAARACAQLDDDEKGKLNAVQYQGIICASLLLKEPLANFYVTNITDETVPFTAVIEMTTLVDPQEFGGRTLVYLPKYVDANDGAFARTDEDLRAEFVGALERMYPNFRREHVEVFKVSRVRHVFPIPTLDYSAKLPPVQTSVPGLFIVNSAHIVNGTLNVNETVQLAETFAARFTNAKSAAATNSV